MDLVVTVVDASAFAAQQSSGTALAQLAAADLVLLNKVGPIIRCAYSDCLYRSFRLFSPLIPIICTRPIKHSRLRPTRRFCTRSGSLPPNRNAFRNVVTGSWRCGRGDYL